MIGDSSTDSFSKWAGTFFTARSRFLRQFASIFRYAVGYSRDGTNAWGLLAETPPVCGQQRAHGALASPDSALPLPLRLTSRTERGPSQGIESLRCQRRTDGNCTGVAPLVVQAFIRPASRRARSPEGLHYTQTRS
jgi:hypothetical protein